ncbi:MAG: LPS export ABC transporter periplasmic protein LptC, partial [Candidatus Eremiobacteraeota bacterium]|nr:LPS export ABC transporter periplasmic protein LptC [Candidatus Eremiobacteraeota bacterium]
MRSRRLLALASAAAFALLAAAHPAPKSQAQFMFGEWNIHTSLVDFNLKTNDFSAPQHVLVTRDGTTIDADRANGNAKSGQATLFGHVVLHDKNGNLGG